jgi:hypothetical protein
MVLFLFIAHPDNWAVCSLCAGRNLDYPCCDAYKGMGFAITVDWPKRV